MGVRLMLASLFLIPGLADAAPQDPHAGHAASSPSAVTAATAGDSSLPASESEAKAALEKSPRHGEYADVKVSSGGAPVRTWIVYPERKDKAPLFAFCGAACSAQETRSIRPHEELVVTKLKLAAKEGRLDGLQIEYWVGGGLPPPHYRSEQFRLLSQGERPELEFAVLRFDSRLSPNQVTEKFTLAADAATIRALANMLLDKKVFQVRFPEETNPGVGDVISHEIIATVGQVKKKRTYYRTMPVALAPLERLCRQLIEQTKDRGLHTWHHQGRMIQYPF